MKAVKGKGGLMSFIMKDEAALFNNIVFNNGLPVNSLDERESHLLDEMFKRNVLRKVKRNGLPYYMTYPQENVL